MNESDSEQKNKQKDEVSSTGQSRVHFGTFGEIFRHIFPQPFFVQEGSIFLDDCTHPERRTFRLC